MSVLHRMQLAHKFIVLGIVAGLMAILPTSLYLWQTTDTVQAARRELRGSGPALVMSRVVQLAQVHRGLSLGELGGHAGFAARRLTVLEGMAGAQKALDGQARQAQASQQTLSGWASLRQRWLDLEKQVNARQLSPADSTALHTQWIADALLWSEQVRYEFGLDLDPSEDTYFLIQARWFNCPASPKPWA